jgi:hypothetical protein
LFIWDVDEQNGTYRVAAPREAANSRMPLTEL